MEFAITLLLYQKKGSEFKVETKSKEIEKRNISFAIPPIMKVKPAANEEQLATPPGRHVEDTQTGTTLMVNAKKAASILHLTHVIDFVAVWMYLISFLVFNYIYWKAYH